MSQFEPPPYALQQPVAPPQEPGYYPQPVQGVQPATVVVTQPTVVNLPVFGDYSIEVVCPNCRQTVSTDVRRQLGGLAVFIAAALCILGCWPCCLIPFCVKGCHDAIHVCPSCQAVLGRYNQM